MQMKAESLSLAQLTGLNIDSINEPEERKGFYYDGPIQFQGHEICALHSPNRFIRTMLKTNSRTGYTGIAVIAPPGHGKTTMGQMLIHLLHEYKPDHRDNVIVPRFRVEWAGSWEFTHQMEFYQQLPKQPTIIVYDDISGALEQMSDTQVNECFEALTTVRHVLGEQNNVIIFCLFHYTKILQKDFRAQLQYKIYLGMGDEEQTNIRHSYDKNSKAYKKLMNFARVYQAQMEGDGFWLKYPSGRKYYNVTDKPFRAACVVTLSWTEYFLFTKTGCQHCLKQKLSKKVSAEEMFEIATSQYGKWATQALRYKLYQMGYPIALGRELFHALHFVDRVFKDFTTDWKTLEELILKRASKSRKQKRFNVPHKQEDKLYRKIFSNVRYGQSAMDDINQNIMHGMAIFEKPISTRTTKKEHEA